MGRIVSFELRHHAKFCGDRSNCCRDISILNFSTWSQPPSWIFNILTIGMDKKDELHPRAKFRQNRSNRSWDITLFYVFKMAAIRHLGLVVRVSGVGTTHEGHLVVFITVQNLVGIDAVVLIICMLFDFASLAWKRLFTPQNWGFLGGK